MVGIVHQQLKDEESKVYDLFWNLTVRVKKNDSSLYIGVETNVRFVIFTIVVTVIVVEGESFLSIWVIGEGGISGGQIVDTKERGMIN